MKHTLLLLAPLLALAALPLQAQQAPAGSDRSLVDGSAGRAIDGRAAINVAAGTGNAQVNLGAIAAGPVALGSAQAHQSVQPDEAMRSRDASAVMTGDALSNGSGALAINQVAGSANAQANVLVLAAGIQDVDLAELASVSADVAPMAAGPVDAARREARIDPAALQNTTGILQINQTAGVGNSSANVLVLQLPGSTR